tara:strand:- start:1110 stop:1580 length:471 start_codon:yes stop_codon:yes gene_type:complete
MSNESREAFEKLVGIPTDVQYSAATDRYHWQGFRFPTVKSCEINDLYEMYCDGKQSRQAEIDQLRAELEDRAPAVADVTIGQAMGRLKQAMKDESDYAYGFHSNIAMMCYDSIREAADNIPHEQALLIGNDGASRFMKIAFDAETSQDMLLKESKL